MQTALSDPDIAELVDRADHSITELAGQALVAGGVNSLGEVLGSSVLIESSKATVTTDVLDYPPGKTVIITGQGWQSNESVDMTVHEEPETHDDTILSAVADSKGNFANTNFAQTVDTAGHERLSGKFGYRMIGAVDQFRYVRVGQGRLHCRIVLNSRRDNRRAALGRQSSGHEIGRRRQMRQGAEDFCGRIEHLH